MTLTWAQSIDGSLASDREHQTTLSGDASLDLTHRLRAAHDAILVGVGTVTSDDPLLTTRRVSGSDARPIILDRNLRTPITARILARGPILVHDPLDDETVSAAGRVGSPARLEAAVARQTVLEQRGAQCIAIAYVPEDPRMFFATLARTLSGLGLHSVMVEGGPRVLGRWLAFGPVDRVVVTIAPHLLAGYRLQLPGAGDSTPDGDAPHAFATPATVEWLRLGDDMVVIGYPT